MKKAESYTPPQKQTWFGKYDNVSAVHWHMVPWSHNIHEPQDDTKNYG
jgi:hypothetical protein